MCGKRTFEQAIRDGEQHNLGIANFIVERAAEVLRHAGFEGARDKIKQRIKSDQCFARAVLHSSACNFKDPKRHYPAARRIAELMYLEWFEKAYPYAPSIYFEKDEALEDFLYDMMSATFSFPPVRIVYRKEDGETAIAIFEAKRELMVPINEASFRTLIHILPEFTYI